MVYAIMEDVTVVEVWQSSDATLKVPGTETVTVVGDSVVESFVTVFPIVTV